jgi:hypothetical protein
VVRLENAWGMSLSMVKTKARRNVQCATWAKSGQNVGSAAWRFAAMTTRQKPAVPKIFMFINSQTNY